MSLATCASCVPMSVFGNVTPSAAAPLTAASTVLATSTALFRDCCAAWIKVTPLARFSICCSAADPGSVDGACSAKLLVLTVEGWVVSPTSCITLPLTLIAGGVGLVLRGSLSASLPCQPVFGALCGPPLCHCACWSAW